MRNLRFVTQSFVGFATSTSALCSGFHLGWASPSLPKLLSENSDIRITPDQSSWIVSVFTLGIAFGACIALPISDRCGRKLSLLFTVIPNLSSCILIGLAPSYWWFIVARFIAGLGTGITFTVSPMYLGEIADDRIRGALGTLPSIALHAGILLTYCVGPWVSRVGLASFGGTLPLIFGLIFIWMPESPYFLIMKQKPDQAEKSLLWLRGKESVIEELGRIHEDISVNRETAGGFKELVTMPGNRKALIIVLGLMAAQQLSGINAIIPYSSLIFEASGSTMDSSISAIIIGAVHLLSGVLTIFTIDLAGRRPLLLLSAGSSSLFLGGEALYFQLQAMGKDVSAISWLPVTAAIAYMIAYTIGFGIIPMVVASEIFSYNVKAWATMAMSATGSLAGVIVAKLYQVVADEFGIHTAFWGFAVITVSSMIFIYFMLPETKQRSLRSIQEELHKTTESTRELTELEQSRGGGLTVNSRI